MISIKKLLVNLRLFDGEGDGQAGTDNDGAANGSQQGDDSIVEYGVSDDSYNSNGAEDDSTEGSGTGDQDNIYDFSKIAPEKREEVYKNFKEAFKDDFSKDFQEHFNRRFKNHKEIETKVTQYEPLIEALLQFHGVQDINELSEIINSDVMSELAEREGFSDVNKYKEYLDGKKAKETLTKQQQEQLLQQDTESTVNNWVEQGLNLKKQPGFENFDLGQEILNPLFAARLEKGDTVEEAYYLVHRDEILKNAAKRAELNTVTNLQSKGKRIQENGMRQTPGVIRKSDPSKLTDADIDEINRRVARGEKIKF
jgi:hypothetical protein